MLDVFVIAVIIAGFKEFPSGTRIYREWGLFCFAASVILSIAASMLATAPRPPLAANGFSAHSR
jgi:uncharacterized paraquat-inducible protein A